MPRRTGLTALGITAQSLALIDREGLEGLSMRKLATVLEVSPMTLYSYFADRDALLESVAQLLYTRIKAPAHLGPRRTLHQLMHSVRDVLLAHPNALPLISLYPPRTLPALAFVEGGFRALHEAGVPARDTARAYRTLAAYSLGTAAVEVNGYFLPDRSAVSAYPPPDPSEIAEHLPRFAEVSGHVAALDDAQEFDHGLDLILDGFLSRHVGA
ncbi:MAG TPA: TetR/AcrR family transcriptional regulator [Nocardioidaceae bacterium]|nr:TetR/AcrR family transcriptional regulator [Nocardioidaceae bacterium]